MEAMCGVWIGSILAVAGMGWGSGGGVDFARDVRPILAANCLKCHGPDAEARQAGLRLDTSEGARAALKKGGSAVVPGDVKASKLIERITATDPEKRMPPVEVSKHGLKREDIETLTRWIESGAEYTPHWSFVAPVKREAPKVKDASWCSGEMDAWVLAKLEEAGMKPSARADKATLIRRATLAITGLPPTPAEVDAFERDGSADAYSKVVERLLASPRFGEKWARWWLDMARYADTKGYEKDERRVMWPYRDWVIRAFNQDLSFDEFTVQQLAGDMLPDATDDQIIATAFHRNTMTNDEGGTDDEEFRCAAIIDRVNTTMEVWQGLTMGCAQCHTHKYDPLMQTDYYKVFAVFNNTEDADRNPEEPFLRIASVEVQREIDEKRARELEAEVLAEEVATKGVERAVYEGDGGPAPAGGETREYSWLDDTLPTRSSPHVENLGSTWPWVKRDAKAPASGDRCFGGKVSGAGQAFVLDAYPSLEVRAGDTMIVWAQVDEKDAPKQLMLQWFTAESGWSHRAYWGEAKLVYGGKDGTASLMRMGDVPKGGSWVKLEIPASVVGLEGKHVTGWAFSQFDGAVWWDNAGIRTTGVVDLRHRVSMPRWVEVERAHGAAGLEGAVASAVMKEASARTPEEDGALRAFYLRRVDERGQRLAESAEEGVRKAKRELEQARAKAVPLPIMRELKGDQRRVTKRFIRGSFLNQGEVVEPGVPEAFAGVGVAPKDRLEFSRWLMGPGNPLTSRVIVNRVWEQLWGAGIVETVEDFGTQGFWPSNQGLLDHLAVSFREGGWSVKGLIRTIVMSSAFQQVSGADEGARARDPYNKLLGRGPRFRLDGEELRDQALMVAGLLSEKMYGPPVFPAQPEGLWTIIYSGDKWENSKGEDGHRRALYTFWRRTVPYPSMTTFDAPSREFCVSRRIRTNTPLQAFVTLNDPAFVECAQAMARRVMKEGGADDESRAAYAMKLATARAASQAERSSLVKLFKNRREAFEKDPKGAEEAATKMVGPLAEGMKASDAAAWTAVCSVVLNLDEVLTLE